LQHSPDVWVQSWQRKGIASTTRQRRLTGLQGIR
jgi:hypothetical protein